MDTSFYCRCATVIMVLAHGSASNNHLEQFPRKHHDDDRISRHSFFSGQHKNNRPIAKEITSGTHQRNVHINHLGSIPLNPERVLPETQRRNLHNHIPQLLDGNMDPMSLTGMASNGIHDNNIRNYQQHSKQALRHRHHSKTRPAPVSLPETHEQIQPTTTEIPTCHCQNGGKCIMKVVCLCASGYYGIRCQHKLHQHSCGKLRHGTWVRSRCNLCRCEDGNMLCMMADLDDCDHPNAVDEEEVIMEPEVSQNVFREVEPITVTLNNQMVEHEEDPVSSFHYQIFPPYRYEDTMSPARSTQSVNCTLLFLCFISFLHFS